MKHIDDFVIHKFRGLGDLDLGRLGQINLLIGNNNSGKTSVLEAFSVFCDPFNWRRWNDAGSLREQNITGRSPLTERITWLFPQGLGNQHGSSIESSEILLSAIGNFPIEKVSASYEKFTEMISLPRSLAKLEESLEESVEVESIKVSVSSYGRHVQKSLFDDIEPVLKENLIFSDFNSSSISSNGKLKTPTLPVQTVAPFSHRNSNLPPRLWTEVIEADLKSETIQLLQFFDPFIQDIDIITPTDRRQLISVKHAKLGRAPLYTFGDGLRRVFTLATTIPRVKKGFLLVDELETAIHTSALEKTLNWLINACIHNDIQLVATTHSIEAVDTVLDVCRDNANLVVYRLQEEKQKITATRFDKDVILRLREGLGVEVR